jgi:hypothetical protein
VHMLSRSDRGTVETGPRAGKPHAFGLFVIGCERIQRNVFPKRVMKRSPQNMER